jgi:hypothetical protein
MPRIHLKAHYLVPVSVCFLACAPIAGAAQQQQQMRVEKNMEFKTEMTLKAESKSALCSARVEIEYNQKNTVAWAAGTLDTPDCAAASGTYTIAVRYRDEAGEVHNVESEESWGRSDDQPVHFAGEYEIGENVDLIRVRVRKVRCECATPIDKDDAPEPEEQGDSE